MYINNYFNKMNQCVNLESDESLEGSNLKYVRGGTLWN